MMSGLTAPASGSKRKKNENIELLAPDFHLCRLYGIVDLGTHVNQYYGTKRRYVRLLFEFPYLIQFYYEEDKEPKPAMVSLQCTLSMNEKATLRHYIESMVGKKFVTDADAESFNIFSLADQYYVAKISHSPDKNNPNKIYENVDSLSPYNARFKEEGKELKAYNPLMLYSIEEHGFQSDEFVNLYQWMQNKLKESDEGMAYAHSGGKFAERQYDEATSHGSSTTAQNASTPSAPPQPKASTEAPVIMLREPAYEEWAKKGWKPEQLVEQGYAKWPEKKADVPPQAPPSAPVAPPTISGDDPADDLPF